MKKLVLLVIACCCLFSAHAAYLRNVPKTLTQPDGSVLHCYASGDEYFNYLHDENGYTIMQHPKTGFFVYADKRDGKLVATELVAGKVDPASKNIKPFNLISPQEWIARREAWQHYDNPVVNRDGLPNHGTLNNISIFIRFSDDTEFTNSYSDIDNMFNDVSENAISLRSYFRAASYGAIEIPTTFYPGHTDDVIISYQDTYPRSYFEPYNESTNPNGYQDNERAEREFSLLERAVKYINSNYPVPTELNIDYDNDEYVDNVCFIVRGDVGAWSSLLWPHKWALQDRTVLINGKRVWTFNFQLADATSYFNTSTMCHEMNHSLGAPDLYHYYNGTNLSPVGSWDLMENNATPPQHCGAYMKMKYGHWIDEIPEITQAGTYTLNPISSSTPTNVAYKIQSSDPNQYYVLEYRKNTSLFETALPGSGLLIYRIDTRFDGNASYDPSNGVYDEVYLFRPEGSLLQNGNLSKAHFSSNVGRTEFSSSTIAYPFFTDGSLDYNFRIYNITEAGDKISFSYGTSSDCEAPTNIIASIEDNNVTLSWDAASNAVSYNIYRGGSYIGNTDGTTYLDSNVAYGKYAYSLRSVDANGLYSASSETVTVTIVPEGSIIISDGSTATDDYLPSYSYYKYGLTQQIYTAAELGKEGVITGIAFFNGGDEKTRIYDFYLKSTTKSAFSGVADWETVSDSDKVFSGEVTMLANDWTVINFDNPFAYDGISNVVLVADDNTGNWAYSPHMSCRVFAAPNQAIRIYSDNADYDPFAPTSYTGTLSNVKNQLLVTKITPPTDPINIRVDADPLWGGLVSGGGEFYFGETCIVTAKPDNGYCFAGWTENGNLVSNNSTYSFTVTHERALVATFSNDILVGSGTETNQYLPSYSFYNYSLTQQIYTVDEIGSECTINSISFYNAGTEKTRTYEMYLVHTNKTDFKDNTDWITVTDADKVFSGNVTMVANDWTVITLDMPFEYNGTSNLAIVMDDNTGSYSNGMTCRVYDANGQQAMRVYSDGTNYNPLTPTNYSGTILSVKNQIMIGLPQASIVEQPINLVQGWGWWSTCIEAGTSFIDQLTQVVGANATTITSQNAFLSYYDSFGWMGNLESIEVEKMYKIEAPAPMEVSVSGPVANPADHPITLYHGINWIGYPVSESMNVATAMAGLTPTAGDIIKSAEDYTTYIGSGYGWFGNLNKLEPGKGYVYQSKASESKTFTYPSASRGMVKANGSTEEHFWTPVRHFANNMCVMATVSLNGTEARNENIEVGAFVNGECRGTAKLMYVEPMDAYVAFLTVSGANGEPMSFMIHSDGETYEASERMEMTVDGMAGSADSPVVLHANGVSAMTLYPNPVQKGERISMVLPTKADMNGAMIEIANAMGVVVRTQQLRGNVEMLEGLQASGIYTVKVTYRNGNTYHGKLMVR